MTDDRELEIELQKLKDRGATGISIYVPESTDSDKIKSDILIHLKHMDREHTHSDDDDEGGDR